MTQEGGIVVEHEHAEQLVLSLMISEVELLALSIINPVKKRRLRKAIREVRLYEKGKNQGTEAIAFPEYLNNHLFELSAERFLNEKIWLYATYYEKVIDQLIQRYKDLMMWFSLTIV